MSTESRPLRVLVVEDETLVLFHLEDMLATLGHCVASAAMRLDQALSLAESATDIDLAILDVNLGGPKVFPVAEILAARGIPLMFATGYGRAGLSPEWQHYPVLLKPYTLGELATTIAAATQR